MGLIKHLLNEEKIFFDSIGDIKDYLSENGIKLEDQLDYYISSGAYGDVYKVKRKDKVIKFHDTDKVMDQQIKDLIKYQSIHNTKHLVRYYYTKKIDKYISITVMEYLKPSGIYFSAGESELLKKFEFAYKYASSNESMINEYVKELRVKVATQEDSIRRRMDVIIEDIKEKYEPIEQYTIFSLMVKNNRSLTVDGIISFLLKIIKRENIKFFKDLFKGIDELKKLNITHDDIHRKNVLKDPKTGEYKIIDII